MKNKVAGKNFEPIKFNFYYWPLLNSFFFQLTKNSSGMKKKSTGWVKSSVVGTRLDLTPKYQCTYYLCIVQ